MRPESGDVSNRKKTKIMITPIPEPTPLTQIDYYLWLHQTPDERYNADPEVR